MLAAYSYFRQALGATWSDLRWQEFTPSSSTKEWTLPGSLATLPLVLPALQDVEWDATRPLILTMPDGATRGYVVTEQQGAGGRGAASDVNYWALDGGSLLSDGVSPLDLLIARDGELIGAIDVGFDIVMVKLGYEACTSLRWWLSGDVTPAQYEVTAHRELVAMSDGVRLAADVYLPRNVPGPVPAILCRTPYGSGNVLPSPGSQVSMYAARGFAVVMQDVRGRGDSEGVWEYIRHEPRDGDETLTWLAAQPWCDGNVGTIGGSYPGHTQWMAAMHGNPALKAMVPVVSMGTPHNDMPYIGGALNAGVCAWAYFMAGGERQRDDWAALLRERPVAGLVERGLGQPSLFWDIIMTHTLYDDYWRASDWTLCGEQIDVPALHISGWYDDDLPGTLANWALMQRHGRAHQRLILGGWRHGGNLDRAIHGVEFGPDVIREDLYYEMYRWHERWL
jgi:predicted acyl esterase